NRALAAHAAGKLDEAVTDYYQTLEKDPKNKFAFYNLGEIAQRQNRMAAAESFYRLALEQDSKMTSALFNLAIVRTNLGAIADVIAGVPSFVRQVVVVNDGSPDRTSDVVRDLQDSRVALVEHEENQGVGAAMMSGYERAVALGAEIIAKMDADGQMDPEHLLALITPIVTGAADYTKGNRFLHERELRSMPGRRRVGNAGLSFLTKLASG